MCISQRYKMVIDFDLGELKFQCLYHLKYVAHFNKKQFKGLRNIIFLDLMMLKMLTFCKLIDYSPHLLKELPTKTIFLLRILSF